MLYPSIDLLTDKVESKYFLVNAIAMRARRLQDGANRISKVKTNKNVTVAMNEIADKQITYSHTKETAENKK